MMLKYSVLCFWYKNVMHWHRQRWLAGRGDARQHAALSKQDWKINGYKSKK